MFRLCRKTIFTRWHANCKTSSEKKNLKCRPKTVLCIAQHHNDSHQNDWKKQQADKKEKHCWDDPQFHFNFFQTSVFETVGWLGTAAIYVSHHLKHINNFFEYDKANSSCIFSNFVLAMPRRPSQEEGLGKNSNSSSVPSNVCNQKEEKIINDTVEILKKYRNLTEQYISAVQNSAGIRNLQKSEKRAFQYFQHAARLGSSQGFYNLGLCFQLGKGTKINFNRAAFCYRKAAMKGHGLASFNLAMFFCQGIGGLPVDTKIAKELLAEAAEKDVPEAQLYFGIEFLEKEKWQEAVRIFIDLAEKNMPEAQYYLGLCYENGLGVNKNRKKAFELFAKSAAQGNERAIHKLQYFRKVESINAKNSSVIRSMNQNNLHVSASHPELSVNVNESLRNTKYNVVSSYLGLISPFLVRGSNILNSKDNLTINENKIVQEYSTAFLPFRNISVVMHVKT